MIVRAVFVLGLVACGGGRTYQLAINDSYEVGEDPTIGVRVNDTSEGSATLVITRPDGSTRKERVPLDRAQTYIRFGVPGRRDQEPTFTSTGPYRVELLDGETVLAREEIRVSVDRLTRMFPDEVADYAPVARYTRARQDKQERWKTYGAIYEHTLRSGVRIHVIIEQPGKALETAWKRYEEEGPAAVIENNNVRFRERVSGVSTSWISGRRIIAMRAASLADLERGFLTYFFAKYPSDL